MSRIDAMDISIIKLNELRAPFEPSHISVKPIPTKKDNPKSKCQECGGFHGLPAVHLKYVGHAALTDRLLSVDPTWNWEPVSHTSEGLPLFDASGGLWIKLTIQGVTRLGYGHAESSSYKEVGSREKEVIGDALRNAAMRFGAALDLWRKGDLHPEEDTVAGGSAAKNTGPKPNASNQHSSALVTEPQVKRLFAIAHKHNWTNERIKEYMKFKYQTDSTKDLTKANYDLLIGAIEATPVK